MGVPEISEDDDEDDNNERETIFYTVCKVGSGLSDDIKASILTRTRDRWHEFDPKNMPSHMNSDWKPKGDDIPHAWIHPEDSIVFEIRGSEIVETETFDARWTFRFPRIVRLREDKNWRNATTRDTLLSMTDRRNGGMICNVPTEKLTIEQVRGKSISNKKRNKTQSQSRSTRRKVGVLDEHRAVDTSTITVKRNIFRDKEIYIVRPLSLSLALSFLFKSHQRQMYNNTTDKSTSKRSNRGMQQKKTSHHKSRGGSW